MGFGVEELGNSVRLLGWGASVDEDGLGVAEVAADVGDEL